VLNNPVLNNWYKKTLSDEFLRTTTVILSEIVVYGTLIQSDLSPLSTSVIV
jgi:hypothetical protein